MVKKESVYKIPQAAPVNLAEPIDDDPYWTVTASGVPDRFAVRYFKQFRAFQKRYWHWVHYLLEGLPTYYCILRVHKGTPKEQIYRAYTTECEAALYPEFIYREALEVLTDTGLQKAYDELLFVLGEYAKQMPQNERDELIKKHSNNIAKYKNLRSLNQLQDENPDFFLLYISGMPDIYEIAGLRPEADRETIQRECQQDSELLRKIYALLNDPVSREKYDHFLSRVNTHMTTEVYEYRENKRVLWRNLDRAVFDAIILLNLADSGGCCTLIERDFTIRNANHDWLEYVPPEKESFFSILGLDAGSIRNMDKKELEGLIRSNFREIPKTPRVNLAYSVLKNMTLREDYLWFYDNHFLAQVLMTIVAKDDDPTTDVRQKHKGLTIWDWLSASHHTK